MLHKQPNKEKAWYGYHIEKGVNGGRTLDL